MRDGETVLHAAEGALSGLAAMLLVRGGMRLGARAPVELGAPVEEPGELLLERVERFTGAELSPSMHAAVARAVQGALGMGWGALLGALSPELRIRTLRRAVGFGAAMGIAAWALGRIASATPFGKPSGKRHTAGLLEHVAYGTLTGVALLLLERVLQRRR